MKQFWTVSLGAFVGSLVALFAFSALTFVFTFIAIIGLAFSADSTTAPLIEDNSILYIDLDREIIERDNQSADDIYTLMSGKRKSYVLAELISAINQAKDDDRIKGIYIKGDGSMSGITLSYEVRQALVDFKENAGKWIYSYADSYSQNDYYLASVADSLFVNPEGIIDMHGLYSSIPYYKGLLDNVGVQMQVFKVGKFKSAVEPYILDDMSNENRLQINQFLTSIWNTIKKDISASRGIDVDELNSLADSVLMLKPVDFLISKRLADGSCYEFEMDERLKELTDIDPDDDLRMVTPKGHFLNKKSQRRSSNKIAVLYAYGEIDSNSPDQIVAKDMTECILDAADDEDIKGLVMRVNSPGGSAFDSEQIWAALEKYKKTDKPFVVSMGDYAASGGYYISCGANRIFAEPTTLTGSIGIFGMVPNLKNITTKIGLSLKTVSTNSDNYMSIMEPLTEFQKHEMQAMVNRGYELFTSRCAEGRNMPIDSIKSIAEGRVWDGETALKLGLVDEIGDIKAAISYVANSLDIADDYNVVVMPEPVDFFTQFMNDYMQEAGARLFSPEFDVVIDARKQIERLVNSDRMQARFNCTVKL